MIPHLHTDKQRAIVSWLSLLFISYTFALFAVEAAGGKALPCIVDVRDENQVRAAVQQAVDKFKGIDILVNNASAISLTPTEKTDMKR